jgi:tetratricopeptide (TPR) repeat protein
MAKKRITRKQLLKEPDEFITTTGKLIAWARENSRQLIGGGCVFFGVLILIAAYSYYQEKQSDAALELYNRVMAGYEAAGGVKDPAAALAAAKPDLERLTTEFGGQPAGKLGRIMYGHFSLAAQARDEAITIYTAALEDFGTDPSLANFIHNGLGAAYSQKGEFQAAIEHYEKVVQGASPVLKDTALFHLGRLYDALGQEEKSRQAYRQLNTDYPESMFAEMVKNKITEL